MSGPVFGTNLLGGVERLLADLRASIEGTRPDINFDEFLGTTTSVNTDDVPTDPMIPLSDLMDSIISDGFLPIEPAVKVTSSSFIADIMNDIIDDLFDSIAGPGEPAPVPAPADSSSIFDLFSFLPDEVTDLLEQLGLVGAQPDTAPTDESPIGDLLVTLGASSDEFIFKGSSGADIVAGVTGAAPSTPDLPTGDASFPTDFDIDGAALASLDTQTSFWDDFIF